jgi:hypothetical protein
MFYVFCAMHCDIIIQHKTNKIHNFLKLIYNFWCLLFFEPRWFILRQLSVQYGIFYVHLCGLSGGKETIPCHQTAHTDVCVTYHTLYTTVSLRMKRQHSKHVGDTRNYISILENCVFCWFVFYNKHV